jgi:hypothetical protein
MGHAWERCLQSTGWEARRKETNERPRRRWKDNINMDLRKIGIDGSKWTRLAQNSVRWWGFVSMVMNLRVL